MGNIMEKEFEKEARTYEPPTAAIHEFLFENVLLISDTAGDGTTRAPSNNEDWEW